MGFNRTNSVFLTKTTLFQLSVILPNDGYFYNQSYRESKGDSLKEKSYHKLEDIFDFVSEFFGKNDFKLKVFYLTWRNRVNIKAMCPELRVWLQITYEDGYPEEEVTEWYTKDKLKQILGDQKIKFRISMYLDEPFQILISTKYLFSDKVTSSVETSLSWNNTTYSEISLFIGKNYLCSVETIDFNLETKAYSDNVTNYIGVLMLK